MKSSSKSRYIKILKPMSRDRCSDQPTTACVYERVLLLPNVTSVRASACKIYNPTRLPLRLYINMQLFRPSDLFNIYPKSIAISLAISFAIMAIFGLLGGKSLKAEKNIPDLAGKVIFVTGGMSPPSPLTRRLTNQWFRKHWTWKADDSRSPKAQPGAYLPRSTQPRKGSGRNQRHQSRNSRCRHHLRRVRLGLF